MILLFLTPTVVYIYIYTNLFVYELICLNKYHLNHSKVFQFEFFLWDCTRTFPVVYNLLKWETENQGNVSDKIQEKSITNIIEYICLHFLRVRVFLGLFDTLWIRIFMNEKTFQHLPGRWSDHSYGKGTYSDNRKGIIFLKRGMYFQNIQQLRFIDNRK